MYNYIAVSSVQCWHDVESDYKLYIYTLNKMYNFIMIICRPICKNYEVNPVIINVVPALLYTVLHTQYNVMMSLHSYTLEFV